MIDIRKTPDVIDTVNAILSNGGVAEIKQERNGKQTVVVEINRSVKIKQDNIAENK